MLLRIRRRAIASHKKGDGLSHEEVGILFVDHDENRNSTVQSLSMDEVGQIKGWPKGFMEDSTKERVHLLKEMGSK